MLLPGQTFFEPTNNFLRMFVDTPWLRYRRVVDVGAGMGHVGRFLRERAGVEVVSVDLHRRPGQEEDVRIADGRTFDFRPDDVILLARPCHGSFVSEVIEYAMRRCEVRDVIYVGRDDKVDDDLEDHERKLLSDGAVGAEGEEAWRVIGPCRMLHPCARKRDGSWWFLFSEDEEIRLENSVGGWHNAKEDDIVEILPLLTPEQMYASPTAYSVCEKDALRRVLRSDDISNAAYGWLAHDGTFWPCGYADHDEMLVDVFGMFEQRASDLGWIKVHGRRWTNEADDRRLMFTANAAQQDTLRRLGLGDVYADEQRSVTTLSKPERKLLADITWRGRGDLDGD